MWLRTGSVWSVIRCPSGCGGPGVGPPGWLLGARELGQAVAGDVFGRPVVEGPQVAASHSAGVVGVVEVAAAVALGGPGAVALQVARWVDLDAAVPVTTGRRCAPAGGGEGAGPLEDLLGGGANGCAPSRRASAVEGVGFLLMHRCLRSVRRGGRR